MSGTWGSGQIHTQFNSEKLMERDRLRGLGENGSMILRRIFEKEDAVVWNGFIWFQTGSSGGLLRTQ
jgi:hypothetical protein